MAHKNEAAANINQPRKFRLTPLNFATAGFFALATYIFINGAKITGSPYEHWSTTIGWIFILFAVVVSLLDIIFRNFFTETKKLWVIELSFITLVAVIFFLVK
ncbi:hypothetical protein DYU05_03485 [Mucilaginibacter terrenus]|uniref:Uncharacterized protein n=1 Tax=Mucilaginibacter terrenus TaxID=2482727 RepID=A0A3E2NUJ3_9SPHI|nr:hypothetical protein [Mucilaginibacter terrenus]RFZ84684.1 hypothetical protein DYU05_03485 [Mucilaginibacter terrenus]